MQQNSSEIPGDEIRGKEPDKMSKHDSVCEASSESDVDLENDDNGYDLLDEVDDISDISVHSSQNSQLGLHAFKNFENREDAAPTTPTATQS